MEEEQPAELPIDEQPGDQVQGDQAAAPQSPSWALWLLGLLGIPSLGAALLTAALCLACGTWLSPDSWPVIVCMALGVLAGFLQCAAAALVWRRQHPQRLSALAAVLLAALLWACTGTSMAHQAWLRTCSYPEWPTVLLSTVAPLLAGCASIRLAFTQQQPHRLVLGAMRAATGACALTYILSFSAALGSLSLLITLICGGVLGLLGWDSAWRIVWRFLPQALLPSLHTWAHGGLVADRLEGLDGLPNRDDFRVVTIVMMAFELAAFGLACSLKR